MEAVDELRDHAPLLGKVLFTMFVTRFIKPTSLKMELRSTLGTSIRKRMHWRLVLKQ